MSAKESPFLLIALSLVLVGSSLLFFNSKMNTSVRRTKEDVAFQMRNFEGDLLSELERKTADLIEERLYSLIDERLAEQEAGMDFLLETRESVARIASEIAQLSFEVSELKEGLEAQTTTNIETSIAELRRRVLLAEQQLAMEPASTPASQWETLEEQIVAIRLRLDAVENAVSEITPPSPAKQEDDFTQGPLREWSAVGTSFAESFGSTYSAPHTVIPEGNVSIGDSWKSSLEDAPVSSQGLSISKKGGASLLGGTTWQENNVSTSPGTTAADAGIEEKDNKQNPTGQEGTHLSSNNRQIIWIGETSHSRSFGVTVEKDEQDEHGVFQVRCPTRAGGIDLRRGCSFSITHGTMEMPTNEKTGEKEETSHVEEMSRKHQPPPRQDEVYFFE